MSAKATQPEDESASDADSLEDAVPCPVRRSSRMVMPYKVRWGPTHRDGGSFQTFDSRADAVQAAREKAEQHRDVSLIVRN